MEVVGVAIGGVGLAALFDSTVNTLHYIDSGLKYGKSYQKTALKLNLLDLRLTRWRHSVDLVDDASKLQDKVHLATPQEADTVQYLLGEIKEGLETAEKAAQRHKLRGAPATTTPEIGDRSIEALARKVSRLAIARQRGTSTSQKAVWALHDERKFKILVDDISGFVDSLEKLFPAAKPMQAQLVVQDAAELVQPAEVEEPEEAAAVLQEATESVDPALGAAIVQAAQNPAASPQYRNFFTGGNARIQAGDEIASGFVGPLNGGEHTYDAKGDCGRQIVRVAIVIAISSFDRILAKIPSLSAAILVITFNFRRSSILRIRGALLPSNARPGDPISDCTKWHWVRMQSTAYDEAAIHVPSTKRYRISRWISAIPKDAFDAFTDRPIEREEPFDEADDTEHFERWSLAKHIDQQLAEMQVERKHTSHQHEDSAVALVEGKQQTKTRNKRASCDVLGPSRAGTPAPAPAVQGTGKQEETAFAEWLEGMEMERWKALMDLEKAAHLNGVLEAGRVAQARRGIETHRRADRIKDGRIVKPRKSLGPQIELLAKEKVLSRRMEIKAREDEIVGYATMLKGKVTRNRKQGRSHRRSLKGMVMRRRETRRTGNG
ncbi:Heterokaryon incompatibility protein S [Fulvia fulva]|nr:Heterokaryon incompatibility protein S [Fulvia fulva]WPV17060.1 Heterokaryon incompatibility protein S [Fulvia fulva]WPV32607.1 Heterokaryon incompatibility protein S [Fulvia fulva]